MLTECGVVITAGGVGPTLDDVTVDAVARAFGSRVTRNATLESSLRGYFGEGVRRAGRGL